MKIIKGNLKLYKNDVRVGNFVFTDENTHIKVQDISMTVVHRYRKGTVKASLLKMLMEDPDVHGNAMLNYAAVMFNVLSVVPDAEFCAAVITAATDCINRHKNLYGVADDIGKDDDDKILAEERDLHDAAEEIAGKTGTDSDTPSE